MLSAVLSAIFIATVFISALTYNSVSGNNINKREYWRIPVLFVPLTFFIAWSANILDRYSGQHDSLLTALIFFTIGAVFYASVFIRDLVSFFTRPGQHPSAFTAVPAIIFAAAVSERFMPNIYNNIFYGIFRMAAFIATYFIIDFFLAAFRNQINKYISRESKQTWVLTSWYGFGFVMALSLISTYLGIDRQVLSWVSDSFGYWPTQITTVFIKFPENLNFLFR